MSGNETKDAPTAALAIIGDEILSGRTQDVNAKALAEFLGRHGVALSEIRVVPDRPERIIGAVNALRAEVDFLFTSGGIGPTHDDITADSVAAAFNVEIDVRADAREILERYYGEDLNEARLRMARIPEGAALIDNPVSHAPGFRLGNVFVLAGVPIIFAQMLEGLADQIGGGAPMLSHSFRARTPEGEIAEPLRAVDARHPDVGIGVYPFYRAGLGATVVLRARDRAALAAAADDVRRLFQVVEFEETPPAA